MPTTTAGTAYALHSATVPGGGTVRWAVADNHLASPDLPLLLYCHGAGGSDNQFEATSAWSGLREWLIDNGWAWVEGAGGGGQPWGNTASRAAYRAAYDHVAGVLDVGAVVPLGRSMGGLVAYWLATQDPVISPATVGLIINSGVTDLAAAYASGNWTSAMRTAYGATDDAGFATASVGHDPMLFDLSEWDGINVIQLVGTADTTVPPADHGLAIRSRWAGHPAVDDLDVRQGGDHSTGNGSYLQVSAMAAFLAEVTGGTPDPAPDPTSALVTAMHLVGDDRRLYPLTAAVD